MMTTRTMYVRIALSLSLAALALAGGTQLAQAAPKRLGVLTFRGPGEGATRNVVTKVGKANGYQIIGGQQIAKIASKLKVSLDTNDSFQSVAKELGIAAFVTGEVSKKKATLTVRDGSDGSVTAEASWKGPNPRKLSATVGKTFWKRLGSAIDRGKSPSGAKQAVVAQEEAAPETGADDPGDDEAKDTASPKKAAVSDDSEKSSNRESSKKSSKKTESSDSGSETVVSAKSEPEETGGPRPEAVMIFGGPRILSRSLTYNQDRSGDSKYNLAAAPELALDAEIYPAAFSMGGFISNIGLVANLGYLLPVVTSPAPTGTGSYKTYGLAWSVGAKVRLPYGLFGTVAYGDQVYQLVKPANGDGIFVPKTDYRYIRLGTGIRTHVTPEIAVMGNLAYLACLSLGGIGTTPYFPKATGAGVEVGVGVGYRISSLLEIQAGGEMRRFGLAMNTPYPLPQTPKQNIAGGAVDQYLMGWVGVTVIMDGGHGAGHGEEAAASDKSGEEEKGDGDDKKDKDKDEDK
jgi:hypothetical protein